MNNLKQTEKLMMRSERRANPSYAKAYNDMVIVLRFKDKTEYTNHCKILKILYEVDQRMYNYDGIAMRFGISDNALRRYRRLYVNLFNYFLEINSDEKIA